MLCFRCMYRVQFLEHGYQPRCECGEINKSKRACYMFKPIRPIVLDAFDKKDRRPRFAGAMFSAREKYIRESTICIFNHKGRYIKKGEMELALKKVKDGMIMYWRPREPKGKARKRS